MDHSDARWSLTPPFHPYRDRSRRYAFCCAFLPADFLCGILREEDFLLCGVRTFLTVSGATAVTDPRTF